MRRGPLASVLMGGLALGLAGGWLAWGRAPDRAAVALRLLEQRCAPYVLEDAPFDAAGLEPGTGSVDWADPRSLVAIQLSPRSCGVSDALAPFSDDERARFAAGAEALGLRLLPASTAWTPEGVASSTLFRIVAADGPGGDGTVLTMLRNVAGEGAPSAAATRATLQRPRGADGG